MLKAQPAVAQENPVAEKISGLSSEAFRNLPAGAIPRIAVLEFAVSDERLAKQGVGEAMAVMMESHLDSLGAVLIERRQLEGVIQEMELAVSGLIDTDTAVRVGELSGASVIFMGSLSELGSMLNVNLRAVDTNSGEILYTSFATLDRELVIEEAQKYVVLVGGERSPIMAALGSAVLPGLGQVYTGRSIRGVAIFGLATAGLLTALSASSKADEFRDSYEQKRQLYLSAVDAGEIDRIRKEMVDENESYKKASGFGKTALFLTGIVYGYGIIDAITGAKKYNQRMQEMYAFGLSTNRESVRVQLTLRIR
jgi:TM2 domain-containing membrane protein YozV